MIQFTDLLLMDEQPLTSSCPSFTLPEDQCNTS